MIEVKNKLYTQRFLAKNLSLSDFFKAVTYTIYEGDKAKIPFWYKKTEGHSASTDLKLSLDDIMMQMKSNTRNEIKRAIKEGCTFEYNYNYEEFVAFYKDFSLNKGLNDNMDIHTLAKYDKMIITIAKKDGKPLAMHATVINQKDKVAMLFYSCSHRFSEDTDRKLIGWANRYLHFKDLELFKEIGMERYEWHSVCMDKSRPANYNIGQFKLSFGGELYPTISLKTPMFIFMKFIQKLISK